MHHIAISFSNLNSVVLLMPGHTGVARQPGCCGAVRQRDGDPADLTAQDLPAWLPGFVRRRPLQRRRRGGGRHDDRRGARPGGVYAVAAGRGAGGRDGPAPGARLVRPRRGGRVRSLPSDRGVGVRRSPGGAGERSGTRACGRDGVRVVRTPRPRRDSGRGGRVGRARVARGGIGDGQLRPARDEHAADVRVHRGHGVRSDRGGTAVCQTETRIAGTAGTRRQTNGGQSAADGNGDAPNRQHDAPVVRQTHREHDSRPRRGLWSDRVGRRSQRDNQIQRRSDGPGPLTSRRRDDWLPCRGCDSRDGRCDEAQGKRKERREQERALPDVCDGRARNDVQLVRRECPEQGGVHGGSY